MDFLNIPKKLASALLKHFGYYVIKIPTRYDKNIEIADRNLYRPLFSPWLNQNPEAEFVQWYSKAQQKSLVSADRFWVLYSLAKQALKIDGEFCEFGVYKGGSAYFFLQLLKKYDSTKKLNLFDTFEGMIETDDKKDWHKKGDFSDISLKKVESFLEHSNRCKFHAGQIPSTFQNAEFTKIAFAHIDLDLYQPILDTIQFVYPRLSAGGFIVFDDYGFATCPGARQAVDEYFKEHDCVPLVLPTGQALVFKP
jgi:O-methyltransferase